MVYLEQGLLPASGMDEACSELIVINLKANFSFLLIAYIYMYSDTIWMYKPSSSQSLNTLLSTSLQKKYLYL